MRGANSREEESEDETVVQVDNEYQMRLRSRKAPMIEISEPKEETVFQ